MALKFPAPLDPDEYKDYVRDWTDEMEVTSDEIASALFELPSDAITAGLFIDVQQVSVDKKKAVFWIGSNNPTATRALVGSEVRIQHTMNTTGGREFSETLIIKIREK